METKTVEIREIDCVCTESATVKLLCEIENLGDERLVTPILRFSNRYTPTCYQDIGLCSLEEGELSKIGLALIGFEKEFKKIVEENSEPEEA
jgi:hypothetical protein